MRKTITRVALVATLATSMVASFATTANAAGTNKTQANGSYGPMFLFDSGVNFPVSTLAFDADAYAAGSNTPSTTIDCPASTTAKAFATARGTESTKTSWTAYADLAFVGGTTTVLQGNLKLSGLTQGTASDLKATGVATRDWSLGIACVSGSSVTRAYYRYISVTTATGVWTAAASDYVYPTPGISYTQAVANQNHTPNAYALPHVGDTINAVIDAAAIPEGFDVAYQWYAGANAVSSNGTSASYVTVDNDAGKTFTVKATYTRTDYTTVNKTSAASATVEGTSVVSGGVTVNATVVDANNGQLALDVASGANVTLSGVRDAGTNKSVSTGTLPTLTVNDGRVQSLDGWTLTAKLTDFTNSAVTPNSVIGKTQLGIAPAIVSQPTDGTATANTARVVGDAFTGANSDEYKLASATPITGATTDKTYVGATQVNAALRLVAPQWKRAGTYTATMTVTVVSGN
ncbi:MAG: hypothetical protein RLZ28_1323 [Actinomycetota bacterium]